MDKAKESIEKLVQEYVKLFPEEFELFKQHMKQRRSELVSDFAEIKETDALMRALFEIPETLQTMFTMKLSQEEDKWLQSVEGGRWFAGYFRVFASGNKV